MNLCKNNVRFEKFPMLIYDKNGTVTFKNNSFEQVCSLKLKSKIGKLFSEETAEKLTCLTPVPHIESVRCKELEGYCAVLTIPVSRDDRALVFLPSYYSNVLNGCDFEIIELICKEFANDSADDEVGKALARVRKAIYRNFERSEDTFEHHIEISKLVEHTKSQLNVCAFPLGVRLNTQNSVNGGQFLQADLKVLATEILCMFDIALYLNNDRSISFDVSAEFNKLCLRFCCNTDKTDISESLCIEKYILSKLTDNQGHGFHISVNDMKAECLLTLPLINKFTFSTKDEHWAEAVFCDAIKF